MVLDLIIVVLLALAAFGGWRSGAIAMLVSIVLLIVATIAASMLAMKVGGLLHVGPNWLWPVVGFIFTFLVLMIAGSWAKRLIRPKQGLLRGMDGIAGAFLGLLRGVVVLALLLALFQFFHLPPDNITANSVLYPLLIKAATLLIAVLKPYLHAPATPGTTIV
jgi:membrane protein required for colicin V production